MKNSNKLTSGNKIRASILTTTLLTVLGSSNLAVAATTSAWSCGAWVTDATNSCVETKKCTRTICDAKGKIDNCRIETETSTATKANCTPDNAKPSAGVFRKGFVSQGVMVNTPSIKPVRTKPVLGASVNKIPEMIINKQPDLKKGAVQQPGRSAVTKPLSTTKKPQSTNKKRVALPGVKGINITKPGATRSLQVPASKTSPTISSLNRGAHPNKILKTPVIFPKGVQSPNVKNNSGSKKRPILGRSGFVPTQNAYESVGNNVGQTVLGADHTGTTPIIEEINIPFAFFTSEMQDAFQGTKVHLNNYGPRHGNSWYKGNDSYVELPASLGGAKQQFSFPVKNVKPFRFYMNDVNLASIQVDPSQGRLAISFNFESNNTEIKGRCAPYCPLGSDSSAPDIQMNNATASVFLTPSVRNGSISFSQVESDFTANIQAQGACDFIGLRTVCNAITDYKSEIKNSAKNAIQNAVDSDSIRNEIAQKMRLKLLSHGVREVVSVEVLSNILVIKHRVQRGQMAIK